MDAAPLAELTMRPPPRCPFDPQPEHGGGEPIPPTEAAEHATEPEHSASVS